MPSSSCQAFIREIYALFFAQPGITSNAERDHIILYQTSLRTSLTDDIDLPDADYMLAYLKFIYRDRVMRYRVLFFPHSTRVLRTRVPTGNQLSIHCRRRLCSSFR